MEVSRSIPSSFVIGSEVMRAMQLGLPIVALETAVVTHGLPRPDNLSLALKLENIVREQGAVPATIGLLEGKIRIGMSQVELEQLANADGTRKISRRDFGIAITRHENGGTTVAGTLIAARLAGIRVFATGGIGGVHRNAPFDISADLPELGRSPMVVVCSGAKAILDLPATVEVLETNGVPILGYQTNEFPAFYSRKSGLPVDTKVDSPNEVARMARAHWNLGLENALLVVQPPPTEAALPSEQIEDIICQALAKAEVENIHGAAVTPFLLDYVSQISGGTSLSANLALLQNNARLAAQIALALQPRQVI